GTDAELVAQRGAFFLEAPEPRRRRQAEHGLSVPECQLRLLRRLGGAARLPALHHRERPDQARRRQARLAALEVVMEGEEVARVVLPRRAGILARLLVGEVKLVL